MNNRARRLGSGFLALAILFVLPSIAPAVGGKAKKDDAGPCGNRTPCGSGASFDFLSPKAKLVGPTINTVEGLVGTQMFFSGCDGTRSLVSVEEIELYQSPEGTVTIGRLEGEVVWGDAGLDRLSSDHRERLTGDGWRPIERLAGFVAGVAEAERLSVDHVAFQRLESGDYAPLVLVGLKGTDLRSGTKVVAESDLDEIECASYWEWRCLNTACSTCNAACNCTGVGFCNWVWLPNCMTINCPRTCVLSGFWDFCDC